MFYFLSLTIIKSWLLCPIGWSNKISFIVPSLIMIRFIKLKAQSENIGTMQGKRPINLQIYGIIANFLIIVILLSVSIFKRGFLDFKLLRLVYNNKTKKKKTTCFTYYWEDFELLVDFNISTMLRFWSFEWFVNLELLDSNSSSMLRF